MVDKDNTIENKWLEDEEVLNKEESPSESLPFEETEEVNTEEQAQAPRQWLRYGLLALLLVAFSYFAYRQMTGTSENINVEEVLKTGDMGKMRDALFKINIRLVKKPKFAKEDDNRKKLLEQKRTLLNGMLALEYTQTYWTHPIRKMNLLRLQGGMVKLIEKQKALSKSRE